MLVDGLMETEIDGETDDEALGLIEGEALSLTEGLIDGELLELTDGETE